MNESEPQLVKPTTMLRDAFLDYLDAYAAAGEKLPGGGRPCDARQDFAAFVQRLRDGENGLNVPEGYVPGSVYWLVCEGRIVGTCSLRHELNDRLRDYGGHIGYSVRPSDRRKGHATLMLRLMLENARDRGIERALVTCDKDNLASARVIQKNGGVLESEGVGPNDGKLTQRYWIDTRDPQAGKDAP